jgi:hypothetical protein
MWWYPIVAGLEEKHIDRGRAVPENVLCRPRRALSWKGWQVLCWVGAGRAWTWSLGQG